MLIKQENTSMLKLALLGKGISHSKSPSIYHELFDGKVDYQLLDIDSADKIPRLEELFSKIHGLSITAPYKRHFLKKVIMEDDVRKLEAINCIKRSGDVFEATNTDYLAAKEIMLRENYTSKEIVILGDGAMAKMFNILLEKLGVKWTQYSRRQNGDLNHINYEHLHNLDNLLIINCCGRGFDFSQPMSKKSIFWDMNYEHKHNQSFLSNKLTYVDGYELLYLQALAAKKFWDFTL